MTEKTIAGSLADAEAMAAALTLADCAGWITEPVAPLLQHVFWGYLQVPSADLLLCPARAGSTERFLVNRATREARSDAALVQLGRGVDGERQVYVALALWSPEKTRWCDAHLPFLDPSGSLWLVPLQNLMNAADPCYRLGSGRLQPSPTVPWNSDAEYRAGVAAGRAIFPLVQEVR